MHPIYIWRCPTCKAVWYRSRMGERYRPYPEGDCLRWFNRGCGCGDGLDMTGEVPDYILVTWEEKAA